MSNYSLTPEVLNDQLELPDLPYTAPRPKSYSPAIALIGCGGISCEHLTAYRSAGYSVVALADRNIDKARNRRDEFFPEAAIHQDIDYLLERDDINILDIATHPADRPELITRALRANKHVLSQKPFVTDLEVGRCLCKVADENGRRLAINQNGRWAPWASWTREAINSGLIGDVVSVDTIIAWDHSWIRGMPFERIRHLILYDFAIHWFDLLHCYAGRQNADSVFAQVLRAPHQTVAPPLMAQVLVEFENSQANLCFRGSNGWGTVNQTYVTGTAGAILCHGTGLEDPKITVYTALGTASPKLVGSWFPGGFDGAMSELIVAIEEGRVPSNSAHDNLKSLELCFAAIKSAEVGQPIKIGEVQALAPEWIGNSRECLDQTPVR